MDTYTFATSRQISLPVCLKINNLTGKQQPVLRSTIYKHPEIRHLGSVQSPISELYITARLWVESKPLGVEVQTPHIFFKKDRTWNKWLELPVPVKDCPINSQIAITIWDLSPFPADKNSDHAVPFGGTTIPLFDGEGTLRKGRQKCKVHRHKAADGGIPSTTPHIPRSRRRRKAGTEGKSEEEKELERLEELFKKHEMGEIPQNEWLDKLLYKHVAELTAEVDEKKRKRSAARNIERQQRRAAREAKKTAQTSNGKGIATADTDSESEPDDEENFTLLIEFPRFDFPVVFEDYEYPVNKTIKEFRNHASGLNAANRGQPEVKYGPGIAEGNIMKDDDRYPLIRIYDPEQFLTDNPCEAKHRRLVRSDRNAYSDGDMKPNAKNRDDLTRILGYGPNQTLTSLEKDMVWAFRRHLSKDKRALTKVIRATDWKNPSEARQLAELIPKWAQIDIDSTLELLGPTFTAPVVRAYAVERLRKADDSELLLYLLQLVQALKFEEYDPKEEGLPPSSLAQFLIDRAVNNFILGNYLYWFLMVEVEDQGTETKAANRKLYTKVAWHFMVELEKREPEQRKILLKQGEMIAILSRISKDVRFGRDSRPQKIERLKKYLADPKNELVKIDPPIPLLLDPEIMITGIIPDEASVFKSSLSPLLVHFRTTASSESSGASSRSGSKSLSSTKYPIIFKTGDDLRQDQLVIQIITLMNNLLLRENLDLKLTPYRILATSPNAGAIQFIPSTALSVVSNKYKGSVSAYLRQHNPDPSGPLGVRKETMDTYIRSCAGYCVITYILGVGDRHLDNLLLSPSGQFFHIDFGFILGRDPKPFAPLIKLCKEMVEGLGGVASPQYAQFRQYCFTTYTTLRKSSSLVLNLFSLMVQSSVQDVRLVEEQMGGIGGVVGKVRERFQLDVSEDEAVKLLDQVLADSVNAVFGDVMDRLHEIMQVWRA